MKPSKIALFFLLLVLSFGKSYAVLNENNLSQTLSELRIELNNEVEKIESLKVVIAKKKLNQHDKMIEFIKRCNELSLVLYSQNQDWTFDMTYTYRQVTKEYNEFNSYKIPYDAIVTKIELEIDRYARLVESLRRLPPQLDNIDILPDSLAYHNDSVDFSVNIDPNMPESMIKNAENSFHLDEKGIVDRDSCIYYATQLLQMYAAAKDRIINDNIHYENTKIKLKESYDYAKSRFHIICKTMFSQPFDNYINQMAAFDVKSSSVLNECIDKYARTVDKGKIESNSGWRGTLMVVFFVIMFISLIVSLSICTFILKLIKRKHYERKYGYVGVCIGVGLFSLINYLTPYFYTNDFVIIASSHLFSFSWIVDVILISILIHSWNKKPEQSFYFYLPTIIFCLVIFLMRIVFVPNNLLNLFFTPLLAIAFIVQLLVYFKYKFDLSKTDLILGRITLAMFLIAFVFSFIGYLFISLLIVIWWFLQMATIQTLMIINVIVNYFKKVKGIDKLQEKIKGDKIAITWFWDLFSMAILPPLYILCSMRCIWATLHVFDISDIFEEFINKPIIFQAGPENSSSLYVTPMMIVTAIVLIFVFRYIKYVSTSLYRIIKIDKFKKKTGKDIVLASDVNLTLANNIIAIIVWGIYTIRIFILFKIPTDTIVMVSTGLAAGIGMAMRDIVNNFIYGIQLMSGRLRLGDWIECDGVRGKVKEISYQCTVLDTNDGAVISFLNAQLLGKNFKNLTKTSPYEQIDLSFSIACTESIENVRTIILDAINSFQQKDSYGQLYFDPTQKPQLFFSKYNNNVITMTIQLYGLVNERHTIEPMINEHIYNILKNNSIKVS